jgi:hypothetical protein
LASYNGTTTLLALVGTCFFLKIENILLGLTIMFCPISGNILIMWVCYVCGLVCELGVHILKPKKVHGICKEKAPFVVHTPPRSLKNSNANSKVKTMKERFGVRSLVCSTSGVEGRAKALGRGLGRVTSASIIHTYMHKPNNKLVSV